MGVLGSGLSGLGNVPTAGEPPGGAGGGGGLLSADDWVSGARAYFQQRTGLPWWRIATMVATDCCPVGTTVPTSLGFTAGGTGATGTVVYPATPVHGTCGVVVSTSPSGGSGFSDFDSGGTPGFTSMNNIRDTPWAMFVRQACGKQPSANSSVSYGVFSGGYFGVGFAGAAPNWNYVSGSPPNNQVDLGVAIDFSGAVYETFMFANFDLVNLVCNARVEGVGVAAEQIVGPATLLPAAAGRMYGRNSGLGSADILNIDALAFFQGR